MIKKVNNSEYDTIQIILKFCESEMHLIVLLPNYEHTYNLINLIKK